MSVKIFNIPRGFEQDLVRLLMSKQFPLTNYAVNNSPPHDTVITLSNAEEARKLVDFIKYDVTRIRGQVVKLDAQNKPPSGGNSRPTAAPHIQQEQHRHPMPPVLTNVSSSNYSGQNRTEKLNEIKRNVRSILATEKKGLDPMRFVNNYQELTSESLFDATKKVGYRTIADFCNDNLDCIDYDAMEYGTRVVFHGIPDAKSAHIFQMNQQTKSRNAPNLRPIPYKFQHQFGNFVKPYHKIVEQQQLFSGALEIPDKHRRRIVAVIETSGPQGLSTEEVKMKYSEMYEEPFPLNHLTSITRQSSLANILAMISKLKLINNRWVATVGSANHQPPPEAAPLVPKDPSTSPEFAELRENVISALRNTPDYTMTLQSLHKTVKIDVMLFGRSSAAELLDLIDEIKVRQSDNNSWIVHLKHKGQDLSYKVLLSIYETLNSDPNGLLLGEFNGAYQRMNGRNLIAHDHGYKSLWHLLYNYSNICSMIPTKGGLLLVAEKRPEPPPVNEHSHPPGFPERSTPGPTSSQHHVTSSQHHVTSSQHHVTSSQHHVTSPPNQPMTSNHVQTGGCPPIGSDEISLGYEKFKEDAGFVVIYINVVYSPTEFYVSFGNDNDVTRKHHRDLSLKLKGFYRLSVNRLTFALRAPLSQHQLCVYSDENNEYHRVVIDQVPNNSNTVRVRSVDSGMRYCTSKSSLYRMAKQFHTPCFARRCALADIRPFSGDTWDPKCREIFGPKQAKKIYFARKISESNQRVELDVIDTHTDDDRCLGDILVAEGYAEDTKIMAEVVNNAPATPNDSFNVVEEEEDDADWLNDWLVEDESKPVSSNAHIDFSVLNLTEPLPPPTQLPASFQFPGLHSRPAPLIPALNHTSPLPPPNSSLWERTPDLGNKNTTNQSPSDYLRTLMKVGQSKQ